MAMNYGGVSNADDAVVNLNVGGITYTTTLGTLRTHRASILGQWFFPPYAVQHEVATAPDGVSTRLHFFIDRNGDVFLHILDYLRTGTLVVPRDPVAYVMLRREVQFYGLPIGTQLPVARPLMWEATPYRYRHVRIVMDEVEKTIEWEEGALPPDLYSHTVSEIVAFFASRGYKIVSEYASRGSRGLLSLWMRKKEQYPGADVAIELKNNMTQQEWAAVGRPQ